MAQHFLLSAQARTLSLAKVLRLTDDEAFETFKALCWSDNEGKPYCPKCGRTKIYEFKARRIFKCQVCEAQFSLTSGTIFASRKLAVRDYLAAIAIFCNGAKGISALQLSRDLDCQYKTAFVLSHKLREVMAADQRDKKLSGEVEVDGAYFGGYVRPANNPDNRVDRRRTVNKTGKRRVVIVMRERNGRTVSFVSKSEYAAVPTVNETVQPGSTVHADEAMAWDALQRRFLTKRINHQKRAIRTGLPAPIRLSRISAAYAALNSAHTTRSRGRTSKPMPTKWRGAKITAASRTARNISALWGPRCVIRCRVSGRDTGSVAGFVRLNVEPVDFFNLFRKPMIGRG